MVSLHSRVWKSFGGFFTEHKTLLSGVNSWVTPFLSGREVMVLES
jgi:hypothetical protein